MYQPIVRGEKQHRDTGDVSKNTVGDINSKLHFTLLPRSVHLSESYITPY